jgi:hypothetical protein
MRKTAGIIGEVVRRELTMADLGVAAAVAMEAS